MSTLAANKMRTFELGEINEHPVVATDILHEGSAIGLDSSGNARPLNAGDEFAGFNTKKVDNANGAAGDKRARVKAKGLIVLPVVGADATKVGEAVYASDDDTFTLTKTTDAVRIGRVYRHISGTQVVVEFRATALEASIADAPAGGTGATAGAFDTAAHRDEAIAAINAIIDALEAAGITLPV